MVAASRMNTHLKNKDQHPGVVDDWENPDDMETGAERLKRCKEKKTQNVAVQKQWEKGKVQVAIIEDKMRHEDVV